jgi:hypothetical protein
MDDREIAGRALDLQARATDFRLVDLAGYMDWSKRKLADGESPALIAHLDASCVWLLPEEASSLGEPEFDEMLDELLSDLGGRDER